MFNDLQKKFEHVTSVNSKLKTIVITSYSIHYTKLYEFVLVTDQIAECKSIMTGNKINFEAELRGTNPAEIRNRWNSKIEIKKQNTEVFSYNFV